MTDDVKLFVMQALRLPIYGESVYVMSDRLREAAKIIKSLSDQLEQVSRDRDAAVKDLEAHRPCDACGFYELQGYDCMQCRRKPSRPHWKWRGVEANQ